MNPQQTEAEIDQAYATLIRISHTLGLRSQFHALINSRLTLRAALRSTKPKSEVKVH